MFFFVFNDALPTSTYANKYRLSCAVSFKHPLNFCQPVATPTAETRSDDGARVGNQQCKRSSNPTPRHDTDTKRVNGKAAAAAAIP